MLIHFERSGGFAGIHIHTTVDTDELPPNEADPLKDIIYEVKFFELPPELSDPGHGGDRFQYRLTIEDGERSHTVELNDASVPDDLQPLLQQLNTIARSQRFKK